MAQLLSSHHSWAAATISHPWVSSNPCPIQTQAWLYLYIVNKLWKEVQNSLFSHFKSDDQNLNSVLNCGDQQFLQLKSRAATSRSSSSINPRLSLGKAGQTTAKWCRAASRWYCLQFPGVVLGHSLLRNRHTHRLSLPLLLAELSILGSGARFSSTDSKIGMIHRLVCPLCKDNTNLWRLQ